MGIGGSILLITVGAVLAFAVEAHVSWLDIHAAGWVLIVAGTIGLALTAYFWQVRRRAAMSQSTERVERIPVDRGPVPPVDRVIEEHRTEVGPPPQDQ